MLLDVQTARVVLLAGPSGSGKTYIARRTGLPVLCLDDFYKDGTDPTLPRAHGHIDWESPESWDAAAAMITIAELAATGRANVPVYDIARSVRVADRPFRLDRSVVFIAEGIFAADLVAACARAGVLADAIAVKRPGVINFIRRLFRDLREHRKPPLILIKRGIRLWRKDHQILRHQQDLGCRPMTARKIISTLRTPALSRR